MDMERSCCSRKKLLYGSYFNSKKGVISPRFYSIFYCAFHPNITVEERYKAGTVFQRDPVLAGAIAYNILTDRKDIIKTIGFHRESTALTDTDMKYCLLYTSRQQFIWLSYLHGNMEKKILSYDLLYTELVGTIQILLEDGAV